MANLDKLGKYFIYCEYNKKLYYLANGLFSYCLTTQFEFAQLYPTIKSL